MRKRWRRFRSKFNQEEWSPAFEWKMDLLKSVISFVAVTCITIILYNLILDRKHHRWEINYDHKVNALAEYEKSTEDYINTAYDVLMEKAGCKKDSLTKNRADEWENERIDALKLSYKRLQRAFSISNNTNKTLFRLTEALKDSINVFHDIYKDHRSELADFIRQNPCDSFKSIFWQPRRMEINQRFEEIYRCCRKLL